MVDVAPVPATNSNLILVQIDDNSQSNRVTLYIDSTGFLRCSFIDGGTGVTLVAGTGDAYSGGRFAFTWDAAGAIQLIQNGVLEDSDTGVTIPDALVTARIGGQWSAGGQPNAIFSKFACLPEALTAAEVDTLGSFANATSDTSFTDAEMLGYANYVVNYAQNLKSKPLGPIAPFNADLGHVNMIGQSFGAGTHISFNNLSTPAYTNALMLGASERTTRTSLTEYSVVSGNYVFTPLVAKLEYKGTEDTVANVFAAPPTASNKQGESPAIACGNMLQQYWEEHTNVYVGEVGQQIVITNCAVGSQVMADLVEGEIYNYIIDSTAKVKSTADTASKSCIGLLNLFVHGESDELNDLSPATYISQRNGLLDDIFDQDVAEYGQAHRRLTVMTAHSRFWQDDQQLSNAILADSLTNPYAVLACATYAGPCAGSGSDLGHPTANGTRLIGALMAKAAFYCLKNKTRWFIPHIYNAWWKGNTLLIGYAAMYYPIQFQKTFTADGYELLDDNGFRFEDSSGVLTVVSMEVVNDALIKVTFATEPVSEPVIYYAGNTTFEGCGNLYDSDPSICPLTYQTNAYTYWAIEEVAELEGEPYPFNNAATPQSFTSTAV